MPRRSPGARRRTCRHRDQHGLLGGVSYRDKDGGLSLRSRTNCRTCDRQTPSVRIGGNSAYMHLVLLGEIATRRDRTLDWREWLLGTEAVERSAVRDAILMGSGGREVIRGRKSRRCPLGG